MGEDIENQAPQDDSIRKFGNVVYAEYTSYNERCLTKVCIVLLLTLSSPYIQENVGIVS
jgi:hypothetical protein